MKSCVEAQIIKWKNQSCLLVQGEWGPEGPAAEFPTFMRGPQGFAF